jgi:hypothetical protein
LQSFPAARELRHASRPMCPLIFFLEQCVPCMMCPLDEVSPYESYLTGGSLTLCLDRLGRDHRLTMDLDLQSLIGFLPVYSFSLWLRPPRLPPFPRIWAHIRRRYWSAKIRKKERKNIYLSSMDRRLPFVTPWWGFRGATPGIFDAVHILG